MQSVREPVFNLPGHSLPVQAIGQPIRTMAYIGPGSHIGYSLGKRVDIAIDIIGAGGNSRTIIGGRMCVVFRYREPVWIWTNSS